jgi:hypothetical protein
MSGGPRAWRSAGEGPRARSRTVVSVAGHGREA